MIMDNREDCNDNFFICEQIKNEMIIKNVFIQIYSKFHSSIKFENFLYLVLISNCYLNNENIFS